MRATYLLALLTATLASAAPTDAAPASVEMIGVDGNIITVPSANVTWASGAADSLHARQLVKCSKGWSECTYNNRYGCWVACCRVVRV